MKRMGNLYSDLLKELSKPLIKKASSNSSDIIEFTKTPKKTFAEIIKESQFNMPVENNQEQQMENQEAPEQVAEDTEGAKSHLASALIALCGGVEEAKACIDASSEPTAGEMPEPTGMEQPDQNPSPMPMPMPQAM